MFNIDLKKASLVELESAAYKQIRTNQDGMNTLKILNEEIDLRYRELAKEEKVGGAQSEVKE